MANFHHLFWTGEEATLNNRGFAMLFAPFINDSLSMYSLTGNNSDGYSVSKDCLIYTTTAGNISWYSEFGYAKNDELICTFREDTSLQSIARQAVGADPIDIATIDTNGKVSIIHTNQWNDIHIPLLPELGKRYEGNINSSILFPPLKKKDAKINDVFERIKKIHSSTNYRNTLFHLHNLHFFGESKAELIFIKMIYVQKMRRSLTLYTSSSPLRIRISKPINYGDEIGYNLDYAPDGKLAFYYEGFLEHQMYMSDKNGKMLLSFSSEEQSVLEKEAKEYSYFVEKFVPCGNGIEVKFHPTGYPASYKTIVKNRLFGRQIAWNDKGEVISDVDLDIPKPWTDAPKKPAEPVVMRTWTSSGGKYHIRAEYVSVDENQVILKNEDGKVFPVALSKLSKDDQNYVKEQREAKPELPKREKE
ncbi:MAG: hypothetical protein LBT24_06700 [Tannerella sp.]|nr:hypothetical protein [Tannerella sp.]